MATFRRWKQAASPNPSEASAARSCGRNTAPSASTVSPASTSSPAFLTLAPRFSPAGMATIGRPSTVPVRTSSCMTTVSCPSGMTAPVKMRAAVLGAGFSASAMPGRRPTRHGKLASGRRSRSRRRQRKSRRPRHWCGPGPTEARPRPPPGCARPPPPGARARRPPPAAPAPSGSPVPHRAAGASCRAQSSRRGACSAWT